MCTGCADYEGQAAARIPYGAVGSWGPYGAVGPWGLGARIRPWGLEALRPWDLCVITCSRIAAASADCPPPPLRPVVANFERSASISPLSCITSFTLGSRLGVAWLICRERARGERRAGQVRRAASNAERGWRVGLCV